MRTIQEDSLKVSDFGGHWEGERVGAVDGYASGVLDSSVLSLFSLLPILNMIITRTPLIKMY
jgi:hypothetical protein